MNPKEKPAPPRPPHTECSLAAILHADAYGYSRLINEDESGTLRVLTPALALMRDLEPIRITPHPLASPHSTNPPLGCAFAAPFGKGGRQTRSGWRGDFCPQTNLWEGFSDRHLLSVGAAYFLVGRPEEAVAPLKQYLSRYPNILGAHLTLAAVYSELGREAEARAEAAEVLRLNPNFSLEVHEERAPIKDPVVLERLIAALRKAGLK